jgi:hypothetical protein
VQHRIEISNKFTAFKNLDTEVDNRAQETIREHITISDKETIGYYELNKHTPWFDKMLKLLDQSKQAKLQWLQHPSKINGDNLI